MRGWAPTDEATAAEDEKKAATQYQEQVSAAQAAAGGGLHAPGTLPAHAMPSSPSKPHQELIMKYVPAADGVRKAVVAIVQASTKSAGFGGMAPSKGSSSASAGRSPRQEDRRGALHVAAQAIVAYLLACTHSVKYTSLELGRVLWLLCFDDEHTVLSAAASKHGRFVQPQQWVPQLSPLLSALAHHEFRASKDMLRTMAVRHPQAVFYELRNSLQRRRSARDSTSSAEGADSGEQVAMESD